MVLASLPRLLLAATLASGLLGSCSGDARTETSVRIRLDTESVEFGCASSLCTDYSMTCGAIVSLRVTDPKTGEVLLRDEVEPLALCMSAPVSADLCAIRDLDMPLFGIPAQNVRIEVAIYNPDDLEGDSCPTQNSFDLFDAFGRPKNNLDKAPAFAGAHYFEAGRDPEVTVPLYCNQPDKLSVDSCAANQPTDVRAVVTDITNMQTLRKLQAPSIAVAVGEARSVIDNTGVTLHVLEINDTTPLNLDNGGAIPVYESAIGQRFDDLVCTTTFDGQPQATIAATCEEVPALAAELDLAPILVRKTIVDAALSALGETTFPEAGIVIGRVVDESFTPSSGVAVTPVAGGTVLYLDENLLASDVALTSTSAYFVATDVPFGSAWTASHFDGRRQSGTPRGGLIYGKVSAVIIRLTGDVIGE